ncbi:formate/nitrite transporter family protein [Acidocella sp.]|uniref:formate/nitrite transporter family protein n=1 Tax=Acidocella sp. TaxID=50710 RepID=UPI002F424F8E
MDYIPPLELTISMLDSGITKAKLGVSDMLIRGALAGAFVGLGIMVDAAAGVLSGNGLVGAVLFPFCFVLITLLSLEFFTGNCALLPFAAFAGRVSLGQLLRNWVFVYIGHLIGALTCGVLYAAVSTKFFTEAPDPVGAKVMAIGVAKVLPYVHAGAAGWWTALVKGVFATWMVSIAAVMGLVSRSVIGKVVATWLPIMAFVVMGFEHCVVSMFAIPTAIMLGAPITVSQWLIWNQIPVTIGNIIGGVICTGLALYVTYKPDTSKTEASAPMTVAAE